MPFDSEPHKISYDRDDEQITEKPKTTLLSRFSSKQLVIACVLIGVFITSGIVIFSLTRTPDTADDITRVGEDITVDGTVTCTTETTSFDEDCDLEIITEDKKTYSLDKDIAEGAKETLRPGKTVKVLGTVKSLGSTIGTQKKDVIQVTDVYLSAPKTPTPTKPPPSGPTPTVTDEELIQPTPTPQELKNNTPEDGVTYQTVTYVIDNKETLESQNVYVFAYLVGGYIGVPGCSLEPGCERSHFILNDVNETNRDLEYDLLVLGGTNDQEGDYAPGQDFYTQGTVILEDGNLYLLKLD